VASPETEKERTDRQLAELMAELRVALPGAQVLLGFLLTVPFATRFGRTSRLERLTLFACLLLTVTGTMLLMAPSIYHRLRWGRGGKSDVILVGHRLFLGGTTMLGCAIVTAVFLVGDVLFGLVTASVSTASIGVALAGAWYLLPLARSRRADLRELE
jgi:Family of unknown function (DUF6328)